MNAHRLLYLSAHQMTASLWSADELVDEALFPATETGYRQFSAYLATHPHSVFSILANVAEEGFHIEDIPFLQGADRKVVIARKLEQLYFNAKLTVAQSLGYTKDRRKNERLLLAALTNNDFFAPWLNAIAQSGAALSGVYSLPLMAPVLLAELNLSDEHCLLLSVQDQSIRQSYFHKGELHFSRLAHLHHSSIGGIAQALSAESIKLQQYLVSQRLIGRNQSITVHILAHPNAFKAIEDSCTETPTMRYNLLDIVECARISRLDSLPADSHCESLFLNLLATLPPRIQFADDALRHGYHLRIIRSGLRGLGALALLGCLLFSGKLLFDTYSIRQESDALRSEASFSRVRYEDIAKTFPAIPTDASTLRRTIDRYIQLSRINSNPAGIYLEISRALQAAPEAELESIDWKAGCAELSPPAASIAPHSPNAVPGDEETVIVRGTLRSGKSGNVRQMFDAFNRLVASLQANPKLQVEILKRPFDIESGKSLKGSDITLDDDKPRAFSLQITRKRAS